MNYAVRLVLVIGSLSALVCAVLLLMYHAPIRTSDTNQLTVGSTIMPLADIVRQVAGDQVRVVQIIPNDASPHDYALQSEQVVALQTAARIFAIGHGLDNATVDQLHDTLGTPVRVVDEGISLRPFTETTALTPTEEHEHEDERETGPGTIDPHYWLTIPHAQRIASTVATELSQVDPAHATEYQQRAQAYQAELARVETELQAQALQAPQRSFIAMHNAWSYFADHYGFTLIATYEPVEGKQPSLRDLQQLRQLVTTHHLTSFYAEPEKSSSAATRFLREELGLTIRVLVPEGGYSNIDSYIELMRFNMSALVNV